MTVSKEIDVAAKIAELQAAFQQQLPETVGAIEKVLRPVLSGTASDGDLHDLHRMAHNLAGSGGSFGAPQVGSIAKKLEHEFKLLLSEPDSLATREPVIEELLAKLNQSIVEFTPTNIPYIQPIEQEQKQLGNLIYLAEDDELLAAEVTINLEKAGYIVRHFSELSDFEKGFKKETPVAIVMDIVFHDGDFAGEGDLYLLLQQKKL